MKKILILVCLLCGIGAQAQNKEQVDKLVPREKVSTGILYNRVSPLAQLQDFGQNGKADTSFYEHFRQAYYELRNASYSDERMITMTQISDWVRFKKEQNTLSLGVLSYDFNYSEELARKVESNSVTSSDLLKIKKLSTFLVSPLSDEPLKVGKAVQVVLDDKMIFSNTLEQLISLQLNFGEGKSALLQKGQSYTLNYASAGVKVITFTAKFSNGSQKTALARLEVEDNSTSSRVVPPCFILDGANRIKSIEPFTPYLPEMVTGAPAEVELGYYYASSKSCGGKNALTKPILLIDGFDAQDKRKLTGNDNIYSNLGYNNKTANLAEELQDQGYDVVIANFPVYQIATAMGIPIYRDGGTDYIERNSYGIIEVIKYLNAELVASGSTEKLTIIGPSMGGIIARYALAYMEKNNIPHNTKLYISQDAPHSGANIPMSVQKFLSVLAPSSDKANTAKIQKLDNPAARQLTIHHYLGEIAPQIFVGSPGFRFEFATKLSNVGFPQNLRRVAVVNGSITGQVSGVVGFEALYMNTTGGAGIMDGKDLATANLYLSSATTQTRVFRFNKRDSNWFNGGVLGIWNATNYDANLIGPLNNSTGIDIAPGGLFNFFQEISDIATGGLVVGGVNANNGFTVHQAYASFISTKSALAFIGANYNLGEPLAYRSLVCTGETPFHAYYAPTNNEGHTELNAGNVAWLKNELINGVQNENLPATLSAYPHNASIVAAPGNYCIGSPRTYTLQLPNGRPNNADGTPSTITSIRWIAGANTVLSGANGGPSDFTIMATTTAAGVANTLSVEVTISNYCYVKARATLGIGIATTPNYTIGIVPDTNIPLCTRRFPNNTKSYSYVFPTLPYGTGATVNPLPTLTLTNLVLVGTPTATGFTVMSLSAGVGTINVEVNHQAGCSTISKGTGTLSIIKGKPVMLTPDNFVVIPCVTPPPLVTFGDNVTEIMLDGAPMTMIAPGSIRLPQTAPATYIISARNACGTSIDYVVTAVEDPYNLGCKVVAGTPKQPIINIFPNPSSGQVTVENILAGSKVDIYDNLGRVMLTSAASEGNSTNIDIASLKTGIYILEAILPNNQKVRKNIVRE